jgi:hypothetical protein
MDLATVNWPVLAVVVAAVLAVVALAIVGLRTQAGQDAAINTGTRLVVALLAWLERWLMAKLGAPARGLDAAGWLVDVRLDGIRKARALIQDVRQQLGGKRV